MFGLQTSQFSKPTLQRPRCDFQTQNNARILTAHAQTQRSRWLPTSAPQPVLGTSGNSAQEAVCTVLSTHAALESLLIFWVQPSFLPLSFPPPLLFLPSLPPLPPSLPFLTSTLCHAPSAHTYIGACSISTLSTLNSSCVLFFYKYLFSLLKLQSVLLETCRLLSCAALSPLSTWTHYNHLPHPFSKLSYMCMHRSLCVCY